MTATNRQRARRAATAACLVAAASLGLPAAAGAEATGAPTVALDDCHFSYAPGHGGYSSGWCDGNRPETYQAWVECGNHRFVVGVKRWRGDRRGSYADCYSVDNYVLDAGVFT